MLVGEYETIAVVLGFPAKVDFIILFETALTL